MLAHFRGQTLIRARLATGFARCPRPRGTAGSGQFACGLIGAFSAHVPGQTLASATAHAWSDPAAIVVVGSLVASRSDNRFLVGYVLDSLIAIFWIVVPNVGAYYFERDFPYTNLFFTVSSLAGGCSWSPGSWPRSS